MVSLIDTEALGQLGTVSAYVIRGKETALVDMGYRSSAPTVLKALERSAGVYVDYLLPTHVHLDHAGACGTLAARFPNAAILSHPRAVDHLCDPSKLVQATTRLFGSKLIQAYGTPEPIRAGRVRGIDDGGVIALGGHVTLRAVWTPGHAAHHLSYLIEETGDVVTGDAVGVQLPTLSALIPTTPPSSFNLEFATDSISRIGSLCRSRLLTPHFGVIIDARKTIERNAKCLREWSSMILRMLDANRSVEEMVDAMICHVSSLAGISQDSVPDHLRVSIKLNILGLSLYFGKERLSSMPDERRAQEP